MTAAFAQGSRPLPDFDPALAYRLVKHDGALLLDVRGAGEFAQRNLVGSVHIPHSDIAMHLSSIKSKVGGNLEHPIVLDCATGRRASVAKNELLASGFRQVTNLGGIDDWREN